MSGTTAARSHSWEHRESSRRVGTTNRSTLREVFPKRWRTRWTCRRCGAVVAVERRQLDMPSTGQLKSRGIFLRCKDELLRLVIEM